MAQHQCDIRCTGSSNPVCRNCECGGKNHGLLHRPVAERPVLPGFAERLAADPFLGAANRGDEEPF